MAERTYAQTISFVIQNTIFKKTKTEKVTFEYAEERTPSDEMGILCAYVYDKVLNFKEAEKIYDLMWEHKIGCLHAVGVYFNFIDVNDTRFLGKTSLDFGA